MPSVKAKYLNISFIYNDESHHFNIIVSDDNCLLVMGELGNLLFEKKVSSLSFTTEDIGSVSIEELTNIYEIKRLINNVFESKSLILGKSENYE